MNDKVQRYIFAGGPGAGKTTVLDLLSERGFLCVPDHPRVIIRSRKERGLSPRPEPTEFSRAVFGMDIEAYERTRTREGPVFFERGIPDSLYGMCSSGDIPMAEIAEYIERYPYNSHVFFFGPWAEIYTQDSERDHPYSHAVAVSEKVISWYREIGFELIDVPNVTPEERMAFVLGHVDKTQ